jgi:hypothetical protein
MLSRAARPPRAPTEGGLRCPASSIFMSKVLA